MLFRNPATARADRSSGRRAGALIAGTVLAMAATLLAGPAHAGAAARSSDDRMVEGEVTMVQANIYTGLTVSRFQADVAEVLDMRPDFITYNEVPFRYDAVLAPPAKGWSIFRSKKNRYTAATPVVWRTDRWSLVEGGTHRISNWRGRPPGRVTELGRRFANWVTLSSPEGRVVSVVSVHVAPAVRGMPDLARRSVANLAKLVEKLSPSGPVLVGGDFNVHYKSGRYPRDLFDGAGLVPTYDMLGSYFPTGDHQGATIDYVFGRGAEQTWAADHVAVELNSDHDAVVAGFSWLVDAPDETQVLTNDPDQRSVVDVLARTISEAEPGAVVEVVTNGFSQRAMLRQMRAAVLRGVHVRLTTRSATLTRREVRLSRKISESGDAESWVRQCLNACGDSLQEAGVPRGLIMVSGPRQRWRTRIDSDVDFQQVVKRPVELVVRTGRIGLAEGETMLQAVH